MAADIGVKIGIEGAAQFKQSLANVNSELKSLSSEMKAATAEFKGNENSQEAVSKKSEILGRSMEAAKEKIALLSGEYERQKSKLDELGEALEQARQQYGENSEEAAQAEKAFTQQETAVNKLSAQLHNAEADLYNMKNAEDQLGNETEETTQKTSTFGEMLKAKLTGDLIVNGVKAIAGAVVDLGKKLVSAATDTAKYADNVNTLATQYNLTTDQVQEFMYMEDLADVSTETIMGSLSKLTKNMGAAQNGTGAAADAFTKLGVEVTNSDGTLRDANDVFMDTIDALGNVENATERDTIAMSLFGKGAQELNPLIALGADGFADLAQEAHEAGYVMSGEALKGAQDMQDGMDRAKKKVETLKRELGQALAPALEKIIDLALQWAEKIDWEKVGAVISKVFDAIGVAIDYVATVMSDVVSWAVDKLGPAFSFVADAAGEFIKDIDWAGIGATISGVFSAIAKAVGAVVGAIQSLVNWAKRAGAALQGIKVPKVGDAGMNAEYGIIATGSASGYYNVPYDNFVTRLHQGEMVLTASEAAALRSGGMGGASVNIYTQQLDDATVDYVIARVNGSLGGALA